jgi:hypothetical protein
MHQRSIAPFERSWADLSCVAVSEMNSRAVFCLLYVAGFLLSPWSNAEEVDTITVNADIWADNWFALYAGDKLIKADSVPYHTERSFNAESFTFDIALPAQLSIVIKDYVENDTGLEYIGSNRQQIGDGGFMAQIMNAENDELVAVSSDHWRCITIHRAPTNKSCERSSNPGADCQSSISPEPVGWKTAEFDDSDWPSAVVHSAQAVRPHGGYSDVSWQSEARLIWTDDLETDNTVLCRFTISAPE